MSIYFEQQKGITEKWIERCNLKFNNKFDYSKVDFTVGANVKQTIICPEHGEFKTTKRNHYESKYGCTQCGKVLMLIESVNNWKAKCSEKFNNKFDYSKVELTNAETKVTIICPIHGEFKATRSTHYDSVTGCYKCGKLKSDSDERMEEFINKVESKFDIKIINCNYKTGTDSPTTSKCNVCRKISEWSCATAVTNSPRGCRYCVDSDKLEIKMKQIVTNWKQYCTNKFNNKFDYSKVPDICSETDLIIIICPIHGEFQTTMNSHKYDSAYGCAQCSNAVIGSKVSIALTGQSRNANQINAHNKQMIDSINNWKVKCLEKFDNRFDYSKVEFINAENKITIICPDHGEFKIRRDQHLASKYGGCPKCRYNLVDNSENIEKLMNDWIARCNLKFNNKFDYSKVKYESHSDKVTIICPEHGEFVVGRNTHETSKSGCKLCSGRLSDKPLEERKLETIKAIESKFDIQVLSCDYIDSNDSKTITKCNVCDTESEWNSTTLIMASKLGCKTCNNVQVVDTKSFIAKGKEIYKDHFTYDKTNYISSNEKLIVTCKYHGDILVSPGNFTHMMYGKYIGCIYCNNQNSYNKGILYTFKIKDYNLWKIGITRHDVKFRFGPEQHLIDQESIKEFEFNHIFDAHKAEQTILNNLRNCRNKHIEIFKSSKGNSEILTLNPINLIYEEYSKYSLNADAEIDHPVINFLLDHDFKLLESNLVKIYSNDFVQVIIVQFDNLYADTININEMLKTYKKSNDNTIVIYLDNDIRNNISLLKNKLNLNENKIFARNCEIKEISSYDSTVFLNRFHQQGNRISSIRLGLYYNNKLVQVMTFGNPVFMKNNDIQAIEIYRLASRRNTTVVGGASKLLKYFERNHSKGYDSIITYADGSFSSGNVYKQLGFEFLKNTDPGYFYIHSKTGLKLSRYQCTKSNLKKYFETSKNNILIYSESHTEKLIMSNNGYCKIITPKQLSFIKEIKRSN